MLFLSLIVWDQSHFINLSAAISKLTFKLLAKWSFQSRAGRTDFHIPTPRLGNTSLHLPKGNKKETTVDPFAF